MASTYLTRTPSSTGNRKKWTWSGWVKKTRVGGSLNKELMSANNGSNQFSLITFTTTDQLSYYDYTTGYSSHLITNRLFRDTSAWSHIVVAYDSAQSTSSNRIKFYVNGVQETSFGTSTYPSQNYDSFMNLGSLPHYIGREAGNSNLYEGSMTHIHFCDGYAYDASSFGESDSVSGIWKPKTAPSVTHGTNGFFLKFENSGAMGTDSSGNSNTFSVGNGTLTQNVDTPTNNFATYNPLDNYYANSTFSNGNTTIVTNSGNTTYNTSTLGIPPTMKCYWEAKFDTVQSANGEVGIVNTPTTGSSAGAYRLYYQTYGISVNDGGAIWSANADTGITLGTLSTSDIVCFAWDGVNQALYVRKNGDAWINSGDPTSGASKTGAVKSFSGTSLTMFPAVGDQSGSHAVGTSTNFGQGYFGTTAVASAGTAPSEGGIFEFDCPSGYQSLSSKGINSF